MINDAPARPNKVRSSLEPQVRYALHVLAQDKEWGGQSAAVREAVLVGLTALGWDSSRMRTEYLRYSLRCEERGEVNLFEPNLLGE